MISSPRIELATVSDLQAIMDLRAQQGWLPNESLLRALLDWDGARIFVVRASGLDDGVDSLPIATTSALAAPPLGVIGNVIVRADYQRRGLGRIVLEEALRWQSGRGVRSVFLDATEAGRPLYARLGFVGEALSWYAHAPISALDRGALAARAEQAEAPIRVRLAAPAEIERVASLDQLAFGGDRLGLLAAIVNQPDAWLYLADDPDGRLCGYVVGRRFEPPRTGVRAGPCVATSDAVAAALFDALLAPNAPWRGAAGAEGDKVGPEFFAPLPAASQSSLALLRSTGARVMEDDLIMRLDFEPREARAPIARGDSALRPLAVHPEWMYAWLAPMVF